MEVKSIPRLELIQVAEAVSREKSIEKEEVIIEAKQILDVEDVITSILLLEDLRIQKN